MSDSKFEDAIEKELANAGFEFEREPSIGGLRPDFLVKGPRGELVIVELKPWGPRAGNTARAIEQVRLYEKATGVDRAFLVLPDASKNFERKGVVSPEVLSASIESFFEQASPRRKRKIHRKQSNDRTVFAAMPFDRQYDDTYLIAMSYAAERINAACKRVDRSEFSGDIVEEIKRLINESVAVIVDLSDAKANVLYEAGYSHALKKPTVHVSSTPLEELPFDVRNWNTLKYSLGQTAKLREPLARRLRSVLDD
jgi:hypothetical protein